MAHTPEQRKVKTVVRVGLGCLLVVFALFAFDVARIQSAQHDAAFSECVRVDYLRAEANNTAAVDYLGLVQAAPYEPNMLQLLNRLRVTQFTNCNRAVNHPQGFEPPRPILIGDLHGHMNAEAWSIADFSQRILESSHPIQMLEQLHQ